MSHPCGEHVPRRGSLDRKTEREWEMRGDDELEEIWGGERGWILLWNEKGAEEERSQ